MSIVFVCQRLFIFYLLRCAFLSYQHVHTQHIVSEWQTLHQQSCTEVGPTQLAQTLEWQGVCHNLTQSQLTPDQWQSMTLFSLYADLPFLLEWWGPLANLHVCVNPTSACFWLGGYEVSWLIGVYHDNIIEWSIVLSYLVLSLFLSYVSYALLVFVSVFVELETSVVKDFPPPVIGGEFRTGVFANHNSVSPLTLSFPSWNDEKESLSPVQPWIQVVRPARRRK